MEYRKLKRVLDVVLAINCSIILSPVLLTTAILVKKDSEGSIIFKQPRTGKDGTVFNIYKFRTMDQNNDAYNFQEKDMVTNVGKKLRKYGIDELPQLLNILKGDMSFIGPRPYPLKYYDYFTESQKKRFEVLPGILGPSTCKYADLSILEKNELDCSYVDNFSLQQDLAIIKFSICLGLAVAHCAILPIHFERYSIFLVESLPQARGELLSCYTLGAALAGSFAPALPTLSSNVTLSHLLLGRVPQARGDLTIKY